MGSYSYDRLGRSDGSVEEQNIRPSLLTLPVELRQYMYEHIFHSSSDGCTRRPRTRSCQCGDNLSITNRQLYRETRALVYKHAKPRLPDVESCLRFLRDIRHNIVYLKSLLVVDNNRSGLSSHPIYSLADVFRHEGLQGLEEFHLEVRSWLPRLPLHSSRTVENREPPIYSLFVERNAPAAVYDMDLRVSRHPLAAMRHLRRLKVEGYPPSEVEEAIFKASRNIEELGRREGKTVKRWEKECSGFEQYPPFPGWIYSISIVD